MTNEKAVTRPGRVFRKAMKVLLFGAAFVVVVLIAAHFIWKYSGSGQWKPELDKNGIKVYSMKVSGSTLKQLKGVTRIRATMNGIAAAMTSTTTEGCRKFDPDCTAGEILEPWNSKDLYYVQYYRMNLKSPFSPRDLVLKTQLFQDPKSKAVSVHVTSLADRLPRDPCCLRVTHVNNSWRYTPLENGMIEVEFRGDYDFGFPYPLFNRLMPGGVYELLSHVEKIVNDKEYRRAEIAFVKEP